MGVLNTSLQLLNFFFISHESELTIQKTFFLLNTIIKAIFSISSRSREIVMSKI